MKVLGRRWIIRHKYTKYVIPLPPGNPTRGGSFVEPVSLDDEKHKPRFFFSELSAKRALTAWCLGKHMPEWEEGCSYVGLIVHQPHRIKSDMEIVEVSMVLTEDIK